MSVSSLRMPALCSRGRLVGEWLDACRTGKMTVVLSQGERAEGSPALGEQMAESLLLHCFWPCVSSPPHSAEPFPTVQVTALGRI